MDYKSLTERMISICSKLDHDIFLSAEDKEKLLKELVELVLKRKTLAETLAKDEK